MRFILMFDIPLEEKSNARQVQRLLTRLGAKQIQRSVWSFDEVSSLVDIATFIKKSGGDAKILEEKFVF